MKNLADLRRSLVVGAGTMGHGIAQAHAMAGLRVDLTDVSQDLLDQAIARIAASLQNFVGLGVVTAEQSREILARIHPTTDLASVAPCADIATEAITEDRDLKTRLFHNLHGWLKPDTLLASNTSGLDVFSLCETLPRSRLANLVIHHYFLPAAMIPLVEVVAGPATDPEVVTLSTRFLESLGHVPIVLRKYHPNFIVNSFQVAISAVAARLLAEGVASAEDIDRAVKYSLGIRLPIVGVVQTYDFTGLELVARILRNSGLDASYFEALTASGCAGVKTGRGLYDYAGRSPAEVEAERDRKYWQNYQHLKALNAFDPV